ncbi:uncharacterized protein LOC121379198 [Gigantopelta aegis]|uniref:uncharacterized protein LOC121379198 n=1 Tax=Gigantopelta aegis TaxID=1735272 RepID=UPI001B889CC9|nr:uncharacterized protein LOC121379198 [Gigantopelta aegis]
MSPAADTYSVRSDKSQNGDLEMLAIPQCVNKVADIYFILDASTSIFIEDYERQREFVRQVVNRFDISPRNTHVGALVFSRSYQVAFDLNRYRSKGELLEAINEHNIPYLTGVTNTDGAIRHVRTNDQFRRDITKVIVVITDGYSQDPAATAAEAETARREGFYLFVIGVGQYTDEREWRAIASDPDDRFMFNITNYRGLDRLYNEIPSRICQLPPLAGRDRCAVQAEADLLFVAGPRGADASFFITQEIVTKIQAGPGRLTVSLLIGACTAETTTLQAPGDLCTDLGDTSSTRPDTYLNLLKDMRAKARDARSRRPNVNQVAVLFLDHESMTLDRFGIMREAQSARYDGIEVVVVDLGVAHSSREILSRMASQRENVFNTAHPEGVTEMTSSLLTAVCSRNGSSHLKSLPHPPNHTLTDIKVPGDVSLTVFNLYPTYSIAILNISQNTTHFQLKCGGRGFPGTVEEPQHSPGGGRGFPGTVEEPQHSPEMLAIPQCVNKVADIYFILDASTSIFIEDYERQREFVRQVVNRFDISPRNTHVGALVFSRSYQVAFDLNRYRSKGELLEAINEHNIPYLTGVTNTDGAIRHVRTNDEFRRDITKVIVIITDGYSQDLAATAAEAETARREGFYLFVIGVGQYTDEREWRAIASDPDDRFMFNTTNYRGLDRLYNEIPSRICQLPPLAGRDRCAVQTEADLLFVAGPRGADASLFITQEIVSKIQAGPGRLTVSLLIGACTAETTTLQAPGDLCTELGDTTSTRPDTYLNMLKDMRAKARDARSRRPNVNQVAVLFLDHESMTLDRFGIMREAQSARYDGIEVVVVDLGVAHNSREILSRMASQRENVFNTAHPEGVTEMTSSLLTAVCSVFATSYLCTRPLLATLVLKDLFEVRRLSEYFRDVCFETKQPVSVIGLINSQVAREESFETLQPLQQCSNKVADVYFILDSSSSIYVDDFARHRRFFREVVNRFDISSYATRVGATVFSDNHQQAFGLNQHTNKRSLINAINDHTIPYLTGNTNTHEAIRYVRTSGQFRRDITKVMVVVTDGYSRQPGSTAAEADHARREGFYLYAIGVGQYTDEREWRAIASDPDSRFMFNISNYNGMERLFSEIPNRICQLPPIIVGQGTCTVRRNADLMFVAGPRGANNAFSIVQNLVDNIREDPERLTLTLLLGACSADTVALQDPRVFCSDFGDTHFQRPDTYLNLLKDMRAKARDARSRRPNVNQVAVLFLDNDSMASDRFGILREARDAQYDGIEVYVVDIGVAHSNRNFLSRIASANEKVFNTAHFQGITNMEGELLNAVCLDLNGLGALPTLPPT